MPGSDRAPSRGGTRRPWRTAWFAFHRWTGLFAGGLFVLTALTGSLLVFYVEIDRLLDPRVARISPDRPARSLDDIVTALQRAYPERERAWRLELPMAPDEPITARYYRPGETAHKAFAPMIVRVDPGTLEVGPPRFWGDFAMTWIYDLHYSLLLDRAGRTVMGVVGLVLTASLATGLVLWWPRRASWRRAISWKRRASAERRVYDIHKLTGLSSLAFVALLALTGTMLAVPAWFNPAIDAVSPLFTPPALERAAVDARVSPSQAVDIARRRFARAEPRWLETPDGPRGVYRVWLYQSGEPGRRFPKTQVWIDPSNGEVLAVRDARKDGGGDTLLAWLHPLHSGEAFRLPGRVVVLVSGAAPIVLFVTGYLRWRHKRRAMQHADRRTNSRNRP